MEMYSTHKMRGNLGLSIKDYRVKCLPKIRKPVTEKIRKFFCSISSLHWGALVGSLVWTALGVATIQVNITTNKSRRVEPYNVRDLMSLHICFYESLCPEVRPSAYVCRTVSIWTFCFTLPHAAIINIFFLYIYI